MISSSNHALKRYCERILNMKDEKEIKDYTTQNRNVIMQEINNFYDEAKLFYTGCILDDEVKNFYINKDLLLINNLDNSCCISLYFIDFGFTDYTNNNIITDLITEIERNRCLLSKTQEEIQEDIKDKYKELSMVDGEIEALQSQLKLLEKKRNNINENIKYIEDQPSKIKIEIKKLANKLINSWEYKRDFAKDEKKFK